MPREGVGPTYDSAGFICFKKTSAKQSYGFSPLLVHIAASFLLRSPRPLTSQLSLRPNPFNKYFFILLNLKTCFLQSISHKFNCAVINLPDFFQASRLATPRKKQKHYASITFCHNVGAPLSLRSCDKLERISSKFRNGPPRPRHSLYLFSKRSPRTRERQVDLRPLCCSLFPCHPRRFTRSK
ncbi:hypothetical protein TRVL_09427 [Trypanosoma vivax]|nr:hypothetical protein TRVL_09427 [Trypanosoma vivax]